MASAWGQSWGVSWGNSWGAVSTGAVLGDPDGPERKRKIVYPWQGRRYTWDATRGIVEVKAFDLAEDERVIEMLLREM